MEILSQLWLNSSETENYKKKKKVGERPWLNAWVSALLKSMADLNYLSELNWPSQTSLTIRLIIHLRLIN